MRRPLLVSFTATLATRDEHSLGAFEITGGDGRIELRGALSAGSSGWRLTAVAARHRNMVDLFVTARQDEARRANGLEDFDYEAVIEMPPGRYHLRLKHIYVFPGAGSAPSGLRVFERSVHVR